MKFLFIFFTALGLTLQGQAKTEDVIQVQGKCETKVTPDRVMITFTAENQSKNQKEAFKKTTKEIESLKEQIQKMNLKNVELKTTGYQVYPVREYEKERMIDKGMKVALALQVTTSEIDRIGDTLVMASKKGIKNVGSLQTFLSQEKTRSEYLKCLDVAADDANAKARQLAKKLKINMGEVVKVIESPMSTPTPVYHERSMMMNAKSSDMDAPSIEAGQQDFSTTIEVSYKIK